MTDCVRYTQGLLHSAPNGGAGKKQMWRIISNVQVAPNINQLTAAINAAHSGKFYIRYMVSLGYETPAVSLTGHFISSTKLVCMEVRNIRAPLPQLCIADSAIALLEALGQRGRSVELIGDERTITVLVAIYDWLWESIGPASHSSKATAPRVAEDLLGILEELASGATDRAAQRNLYMSARTSMPAALGIWVLVSVFGTGLRWVVSDGRGSRQAGLLAMVMTAGATRVRVSFAVAWPKLLGDFDLRAR